MRRLFKKPTAAILALTLCLGVFSGCRKTAEIVLPTQSPTGGAAPSPATDLVNLGMTDGEFALPLDLTDTLDPFTCVSEVNRVVIPLIYDGLFSVDGDFNFENALCESYTMDNDRFYRFKLREAYFSDGSPVTVGDAVWSINTARNSGSRFASRLSAITAVYESGGELVIETLKGNPRLPALLDVPICKSDNSAVGAGAYVISEADGKRALVPNSRWWGDAGLPSDCIYLYAYSSSSELISSFGSSQVDLVTTDLTATSAPGFTGDYDIWNYNSTTMLYIAYNLKRPVFTIAGSRRIIGLGIDRERIVEEIYGSHAVAATLPVHPDSPYYSPEIASGGAYSTQRLKSTLEEYHFGDVLPDGIPDVETYYGWFNLDVDLVVNTENPYRVEAARLIADAYKEFRIKVTLRELPWSDYYTAVTTGDFDMYIGEVTLSPDFNLYKLMGRDGVMNYGGYKSDEAEAYLDAGIYDDAFFDFFLKSAPFSPILFKDYSVLTRRGTVQDLAPAQDDVFYGLGSWSLFSAAQVKNGT